MEKRLIIALALSLAVLLIFQPSSSKRRKAQKSTSTQHIVNKEVAQEEIPQEPVFEKKDENLTEIVTDKYRLVFSDIDAGLKKITLREYKEKEQEQVIYNAGETDKYLFTLSGGILSGIEREKYKSVKKDNALEYTFEEAGTIAIKKTYRFHNSLNHIYLDVEIENLAPKEKPFSFQIQGPSKLQSTEHIAGRSFSETVSLIGDEKWKVKKTKGIQEKTGEVLWTGAKTRYFTLIMKPFAETQTIRLKPDNENNMQTEIKSKEYRLLPDQSVKAEYLLYAGPLSIKELKETGYRMEEIVDYGFFGGVSKKLLDVLRFFHTITRNWGLAIILLTLLINTILFPLTLRSFSSMQKMKKVQPHIQKLKELHKDNPQKMNKEMMELYKKYNVNPLGGCLPMLLQMPVFIALYQGLIRSIELKGASFLWIKDLSRPDAVPLPFVLPFLGKSINILPLLMVGMMILQQKISQSFTPSAATEEQARQQRTMMLMMPLFFGFLFYRMPSGLVLYWLTNTILMTAEQTFISKRAS